MKTYTLNFEHEPIKINHAVLQQRIADRIGVAPSEVAISCWLDDKLDRALQVQVMAPDNANGEIVEQAIAEGFEKTDAEELAEAKDAREVERLINLLKRPTALAALRALLKA